MSDTTPCYIGRAACGCVRLAIVDEPFSQESTHRELSKAARHGLTIELVTVDEARPLIKTCPHGRRRDHIAGGGKMVQAAMELP